MDEYIYPRISEDRRKRFFKYLAVEWKLHKYKSAKKYRKGFVEKLDTLRGVESISQLKKEKRPVAPERSEAAIERKIKKVLEKEQEAISSVDLKEEINRSKIDEVADRMKQMQDVIEQLMSEKKEQKRKEAELEKRLFSIKKKQVKKVKSKFKKKK